jgi:hypothetical protein
VIIRLVGSGVGIQRAYTAIATARYVNTNNKIFFGVKKGVFAHKPRPPFNRVAVGRKCMKYPHHVTASLVKLAISGISKVKTFYCFAAF